MKILMLADHEEKALWDNWSEKTAEALSDISLILSAGDVCADYLEFLVTMMNVPLVYVRGNHDGAYESRPPEGCIDADGSLVEVECRIKDKKPQTAGGATGDDTPQSAGSRLEGATGGGACIRRDAVRTRRVRILGLGGSMRYSPGASDMYTEAEMRRRLGALSPRFLRSGLGGLLLPQSFDAGQDGRGESSTPNGHDERYAPNSSASTTWKERFLRGASFDILLTHAPCRGYGDLPDIPHNGFECFNELLNRCRPAFHCYGHIHEEYKGAVSPSAYGAHGLHVGAASPGHAAMSGAHGGAASEPDRYAGFHRIIVHPSGTTLINACGHYIAELPD